VGKKEKMSDDLVNGCWFEEVVRSERSMLILYDMPREMRDIMELLVAGVDDLLVHEPEIMVYGKVCRQRRSVGFFSDEAAMYNYRNTKTASIPLTDELKHLIDMVNKMFCSKFNGVLINKYAGGEEYIGKHSDDETGLDESAGVIALSWGQPRTFRIRDKQHSEIVADILTDPHKIIQMAGEFQREFTHEIPVEKKVGNGVRYSLTFRKHCEADSAAKSHKKRKADCVSD
jgi:alkylated DNA repair dioxygenase AlkB